MSKIYRLMLLLLLVAGAGGCKKFLDVKPEDKYTDDQVFSSEGSIQKTLNGIYTGLADNTLYGSRLTMQAVDIIGQRYDPTKGAQYYDIFTNYGQQGPPGSTFDSLWISAYALVLRTNNFIEQLQKIKGKGIVSDGHYSQLLGEALAIRAFVQFDVLRLYGPQYTGDDQLPAIPYYTSTTVASQPIQKFGEVITAVLADLGNAETLLASDPIIGKGVIITASTVDFYEDFRNRRLNYYAVKALQARVNLYAGKNSRAHDAAKVVVDASDKIFPWTDYTAILGNENPDRIFSSEVVLGIYNSNLYTLQNLYFSSSLVALAMLVPTNDQLTGVFEGNENDYRYTSTWLISRYGFRTFYKYADLDDQTKTWRFFQPLIRKTEMYYILAETETDPVQAVHYLNQVRFNRGLTDLPDNAPLTGYGGEIEKEYNKEFYGEGQMFFYYKRINPSWISFSSYRVPIPFSETQLRGN